MFPSPTKRIQKKWRKNHIPALGNLLPSGTEDSSSIHDSRSRAAVSSCLWLCSSQVFQELPKKGSFHPKALDCHPQSSQLKSMGERILMGLPGANKQWCLCLQILGATASPTAYPCSTQVSPNISGHSGSCSVSIFCKPVSGHGELDTEEEKLRHCMGDYANSWLYVLCPWDGEFLSHEKL